MRDAMRRTALAAGLGPPVRGAKTTVRRSRRALVRVLAETEPPVARRERIDNQNLRLLLSFALTADANCIDVGAHEGVFLDEILRTAPRGRHIAYEPLPHLHEALTAQFPGVDVRCAALSDRDEVTTFRWIKNMPGMSGLRERDYPAEPDLEVIDVLTERLDYHLPPDYAPSFIKIDVEGAELLVLRGALETLRRHHPTLAFEYGRGTQFTPYGTRPGDIYDFLNELGYRIFDLEGNGPLPIDEFSTTKCWNFIAHE